MSRKITKKYIDGHASRLIICCIIAAVSVLCAVRTTAQTMRQIRGIVRDSVTTEGLPYASITTDGGTTAVADANGVFEFPVPASDRSLRAASQGYAARTVPLWTNSFDIYDIYLPAQAQELDEIVVHRQKYSKRNNPAVDFAARLRQADHLTDPERNDYFAYDKYERISLGVHNFNTDSTTAMMRRFPFLAEHVDTSGISGRPVLTMSVKERVSTQAYRRAPQARKQIVRGISSRGVDDFLNQDNVQTVLDDLLREVDLYDSDMTLLRNTFVSPLSAVAPDFYRFYLVDTVLVDDVRCVVLAFYPRNRQMFGFSGHVYVADGDSALTVRRVEMRTPADINLNFIRELHIIQNFDVAPDGSRLKTADELEMNLQVMPGTPELYISRKIAMRNHSFEQLPDSVYSRLANTHVEDGSTTRDAAFWDAARTIPQRQAETRTGLLRERLRSVPLYYWGEKIVGYLFSGYVGTSERSCFDIGPLNTIASYNSLEGLRLRAGGMTTANLSPRWFGRGYVAYGFRDRKWKYGAEVEYSFVDKKYHSREFPVRSLRLTHSYDVDRLGSHYLFTNADNFVLSLQRMSNPRFTYRRLTRLDYTLELDNNISVVASAENVRQEPSPYVSFTDFNGLSSPGYSMTAFGIQLRYAPGETYFQTKTSRFPINEDAPVIVLSHRYAPRGLFGARFGTNRTDLSLTKQFRLSFFGSVNMMLAGGHVWEQTPFPELPIPNANLSYTIQPYSFALMNPMEFINSSYVHWDVTYQARGALLNLIPGVRRLGLREVLGFRGIYGTLSKANTPGASNPALFLFPADADTRPMDRGPYMEIAVGLDNILRFIRLDYVWRLTYTRVPYRIDRRGLRVAVNVTF